MLLITLSISVLISVGSAQECPPERQDPIRSYEAQIHELITSKPCSTDHPLYLDPDGVLKIKVHFFLKRYEFDPSEEVFTIHSWVALVWHNLFLTWKPEEYGGIGDVLIHSMDIWTPTLEHFNAVDSFYGSDEFSVLCSVYSDGKVVCIPRMQHDVICNSKLGNWPYDTQRCTLHFGTTDALGQRMNFTFDSSKAVSVGGAEASAGWFLKSHSSEGQGQTLNITFVVERAAEDIAVMFVAPSFVSAVITISALLISVNDNVRIGLLCFNCLNQFYLLQDVSFSLPKYSTETPILLSLICGLMMSTVACIILTIILTKFCAREKDPKWSFVTKINSFMENGYGKYFILAMELKEESKVKVNREWLGLCNFVNSLSLILILFVYFVLFVSYLPAKFPSN